MKVYDILTPYNYSQTHSVVATTIGEAERLYKAQYGPARIIEIRLHAEYVIVQDSMIGDDPFGPVTEEELDAARVQLRPKETTDE